MGIIAELRRTAAKLMKIGKFAADSAVGEVYGVVNGKSNPEKKNLVVVEEMQAKLEQLRQDKTNIEQQQDRLNKHFCDEPLKMPEESRKRKIFIQSRL